jgi:hypothetical protein
MAIKKYDVTGDPTPDNTAGGTNAEADRPASSDVLFDALALKMATADDAAAAVAAVAPGITMTGAINLVGAGRIHLDEALATDLTYSGVTCDGVAGEAVVFGDLVYQDVFDLEWYKTDKGTALGAEADGMLGIVVTASAAHEAAILIALPGSYIRHDGWAFPLVLQADCRQYVGVAGALADEAATASFTSGDWLRCVGTGLVWATTKFALYFLPSNDIMEIA